MRHREDAAAAVELTILLPLLLMLLGVVIEFGWALTVRTQLQEGVEEAVIVAARQPLDPDGARARAVEAVSAIAVSLDDIVVTCPDTQEVRVTITHDHPLVTPFLPLVLSDPLTLNVSADSDVLSAELCRPSP